MDIKNVKFRFYWTLVGVAGEPIGQQKQWIHMYNN